MKQSQGAGRHVTGTLGCIGDGAGTCVVTPAASGHLKSVEMFMFEWRYLSVNHLIDVCQDLLNLKLGVDLNRDDRVRY